MSANKPDATVSTDGKKPKKSNLIPGGGKRRVVKKRITQLTPGEKAEAVMLWRTGEVTLQVLAEKFNKRPETMSRLFTEMGITKGEAAKEHQAKVTAEVEAKLLSDVSVTAARIAKIKEEHFKMADSLGKLVWKEIVECKQAGRKLDTLRNTMHTLQLASTTLGKVRAELYDILQVEKHEKEDDDDSLPELTVRELTSIETAQIRGAVVESEDELDLPDLEIDESLAEVPEGQVAP